MVYRRRDSAMPSEIAPNVRPRAMSGTQIADVRPIRRKIAFSCPESPARRMRSRVTSGKNAATPVRSTCGNPLGDAQSRSTIDAELACPGQLVGVATRNGDAPDDRRPRAAGIRVHDVDGAPVGQRRNRGVRYLLQNGFVVQRLREKTTGLGQKRSARTRTRCRSGNRRRLGAGTPRSLRQRGSADGHRPESFGATEACCRIPRTVQRLRPNGMTAL